MSRGWGLCLAVEVNDGGLSSFRRLPSPGKTAWGGGGGLPSPPAWPAAVAAAQGSRPRPSAALSDSRGECTWWADPTSWLLPSPSASGDSAGPQDCPHSPPRLPMVLILPWTGTRDSLCGNTLADSHSSASSHTILKRLGNPGDSVQSCTRGISVEVPLLSFPCRCPSGH